MVKGKTVYRNDWFSVEQVGIGRFGKKGKYYRIVTRDTVCVVALHQGKILMERQYRWALGKHMYELPAGYGETGEKPIDTARRELEEETGYRAGRMRYLFKAHPSPGSKIEVTRFYLAIGLERKRARRDVHEVIKVLEVTPKEALAMVRKNRIIDEKSISALLFCAHFGLIANA